MPVSVSLFGPPHLSAEDHLPRWRPALRAWGRYMEHYSDKVGDDESPFAYNERACVGLLSAGILRANKTNVVLEEYRCSRRLPVRADDKPRLAPGRADLWGIVNGHRYLLEAKFNWASCQTEEPYFGKVKGLLGRAMRQARRYTDKTDHYAAAVFVVPYLAPSSSRLLLDVRRELRCEVAETGNHVGIRADYYPGWIEDDWDQETYRFPGITLFLAFRRR